MNSNSRFHMNLHSRFQLNIQHEEENNSYAFTLSWPEREPKIIKGRLSETVHLKSFPDLNESYETWARQYLKYYKYSYTRNQSQEDSPSNDEQSGGGFLSNNDLLDDVTPKDVRRQAVGLYNNFERWLTEPRFLSGERSFQQIEYIIRDELTLLRNRKRALQLEEPILIDVCLSCDQQLQEFPWEIWLKSLIPEETPSLPIDTLRLRFIPFRPSNIEPCVIKPQRNKKPRILVIIGDDPDFDVRESAQILKNSLRSIAEEIKEFPVYNYMDKPDEVIRQELFNQIRDNRGWDVIVFCCHNDLDEKEHIDERLTLIKRNGREMILMRNDLENPVREACQKGLQLVILPTCHGGWQMANFLMNFGLQVIAMRRRVIDQVSLEFLDILSKELAKFKDVHQCLIETTRTLKQDYENTRLPSSYLLPSYFSPANTVPFQIEANGWKDKARQWLPTKPREWITLVTLLAISFIGPLHYALLDLRYLVQAPLRALVKESSEETNSDSSPPILLIDIDKASANEMSNRGLRVEPPIDPRYLAELVTKLSNEKVPVIGIEYLLNYQEYPERTEILTNSLKSSVRQNNTWFILNIDKDWIVENDPETSPPIVQFSEIPQIIKDSTNYVLLGYYRQNYQKKLWQMDFSQVPYCDDVCSFASSLALSQQLSNKRSQNPEDNTIPFPSINSGGEYSLKVEVSEYAKDHPTQGNFSRFLQNIEMRLGISRKVDFSIPPTQIYQKLSATALLNQKLNTDSLGEDINNFQNKIVIIVAGNYYYDFRRNPNYSPPVAFEYWCLMNKRVNKNCSQKLTTGEVYAYQTYHFLNKNPIIVIPDFWLILMAVISGKGISLYAQKQPRDKRKIFLLGSLSATGIYTIICLSWYSLGSVVLPWFLPTLTFWLYLFPVFRRRLR